MPLAIGPMPCGSYYQDSCARCGRADGCWDTDIEIPYEGHIAICQGCIADLAQASGLTPPAEACPIKSPAKKADTWARTLK